MEYSFFKVTIEKKEYLYTINWRTVAQTGFAIPMNARTGQHFSCPACTTIIQTKKNRLVRSVLLHFYIGI
ncbi:hypothetical protein D6S11_17480 [Salmonella enterica subsp. enterica]|nr:hypothetical protein [Salmonella enterica subsp. enterica serovar Isaszeg]